MGTGVYLGFFLRQQSFPIAVNWFGNIQGKMTKTCLKIEKSATFEKKPQFLFPSPALRGNSEKRSKLWNGSSFDKLAWSVLDFSRDTFCAKLVQERDFTGSLISLQIIDTLKLKINFQYFMYNPLSRDYNSTEIYLKNWSSWAFFSVYVWIAVFFIIGIRSIEGWRATTRYEVTR